MEYNYKQVLMFPHHLDESLLINPISSFNENNSHFKQKTIIMMLQSLITLSD